MSHQATVTPIYQRQCTNNCDASLVFNRGLPAYDNQRQGDWKQEALLQCFLERSQSADIQVDWHISTYEVFDRYCPLHYSNSIQRPLRTLTGHSGRITSLHCASSDPTTYMYYSDGRIWDVLDEHPPPLVHLKISDRRSLTTFSERCCTRISSMFPMLQTLTVVAPGSQSDSELWTLPFKWALPHTLTSLDITYSAPIGGDDRNTTEPWTAILQQLRSLQNLQTLKLCNVVGHYDTDDHDTITERLETATLPSLRSLTLKGTNPYSGGHIPLLEFLVMPSLAQFDIDILVQGLDDSILGHLHQTIFPRLYQAFLEGPALHSHILVLRQNVLDTSRYCLSIPLQSQHPYVPYYIQRRDVAKNKGASRDACLQPISGQHLASI